MKKQEIADLLSRLKHHIDIDPSEGELDTDDTPTLEVTIACSVPPAQAGDDWSYQTGDNSYYGNAYSYTYWAVVFLTPDSDTEALAEEIWDQLEELTHCS